MVSLTSLFERMLVPLDSSARLSILFAGKLDYSTMDGLDRSSSAEAVSSAEGDWRDWEAIGEWAHGLQPVL